MFQKYNNQKSKLMFTIFICFGLFIAFFSIPKLSIRVAASVWTQTSDIDFDNGTLNNLTIVDKGNNAELEIIITEKIGWNKKNPATSPFCSYYNAMASIYGDDKVMLFGGYDNSKYLNETWIYDLSNNTWILKITSNNPPARLGLGMASIWGDDKIVIFGGVGDSYYLNDTWVYDVSDNTWTKKDPMIKPSKRGYLSMASIYGDDKIMLFGGYVWPGGPLNDTWIYDLSEDSWIQKYPINNPTTRQGQAIASIYGTDKVLLFGGYGTSNLGDTWVYDLKNNTWSEKTPKNKPTNRYWHAIATIYETDRVLLFGGTDDITGLVDDTWIFDLSINNWTKKSPINKPSNRYCHTMATIDGMDRIVLFGGRAGLWNIYNDTWIYKYDLQPKNGTYISKPFDTGSNSTFKSLTWHTIIPANTSIEIQLRSANNESNLFTKEFIGPNGATSTFYTISPSEIWCGHNGDQWIQFKVYLNMNIFTISPSLKEVTIEYNCLPETIMVGPDNGSLLAINKPIFKWTFIDFDSEEQKAFQVKISDEVSFENITFNSGEQNIDEQHWEFPTGTSYTEIPDGIWYWKVRTKDEDNVWTEFSSPWEFRIDTQTPSSAPNFPDNNGYYKNVYKISGVANDATTGSGLNRVEINIKRINDNNYWNGTTWVSLQNWLLATGKSNWIYDSSNINWTSGMKYTIQSRAIDNASNIEQPTIMNTFAIDMDSPISHIENPIDNKWLNKLDAISGTSLDNIGSGINKVEVNIKCSEDYIMWDTGPKKNHYWNGNEWTSKKVWLLTTGTTQWSYDTTKISWTTGDAYAIQSRAIDNTDNIEDSNLGITFMYDRNPPKNLKISINKNIEYTNSTSVILSLQAEDIGSGLSQMAFSSDSAVWSDWESFNITRSYELAAGDGKKTIYFKVQDFTGNIAEHVFDIIYLDTIPPEDLSIVINDNSKYTNSRLIKLTLKATDKISGVGEISFSYDGFNWLSWEPFIQSKYLTFSKDMTEGEKRIFFIAKDKVGNIAESVFDSIILDTLPPYALSILINNGQYETNSTSVILTLNAVDNTSGISQVSFSDDGEIWSNWEEFNAVRSYDLLPGNGRKMIYFKAKDNAGNIARPKSGTIMLNITTPPKEEQTTKTPSSSDLDFWMILFITTVAIFLLIIISMIVIMKRKRRIDQELLPTGTLTIKPGGLTAPVISVDEIPATLKLPQLPGTTVASGVQQPSPSPIPILAKSTQIAQAIVPQQTPTVQIPQLPQLPPAKIQEQKPEVSTSTPIPTVRSPLLTSEIPSELETPKITTPQAVTTLKIAQEPVSSSGPTVHLPDSMPTATAIPSQSKPLVAKPTPPIQSKVPTVTTPKPSVVQQPPQVQIRETPIVTQKAVSPVPTPTVKTYETPPELQKTIPQKKVKSNNSQNQKFEKETKED